MVGGGVAKIPILSKMNITITKEERVKKIKTTLASYAN
jgi:hypothetical protein